MLTRYIPVKLTIISRRNYIALNILFLKEDYTGLLVIRRIPARR